MRVIRFAFAALAFPVMLAAQDSVRAQSKEPLPVRTFTLRNLNQEQAGRLVGPYVYGANAAVFPGATSHEITIRGSRRTIEIVDSLLRERDKPSATVSLRFQLYAAVDSGGDQLPQDIGTALRAAFRFNGYRMISQGSISTSEDASFSTTLGTAGPLGDATLYRVGGRVESIAGNLKGTLPLTIRLSEMTPAGAAGAEVFATGLTVPLGQTVVLGSGAVRKVIDSKPRGQTMATEALILAVHPEIVVMKPE